MAKKLIRDNTKLFNNDSVRRETNKTKLNKLYIKKIIEELNEVCDSDFKDIFEFADLSQVVDDWALVNGFSEKILKESKIIKFNNRGNFTNLVLKYKKRKEETSVL